MLSKPNVESLDFLVVTKPPQRQFSFIFYHLHFQQHFLQFQISIGFYIKKFFHPILWSKKLNKTNQHSFQCYCILISKIDSNNILLIRIIESSVWYTCKCLCIYAIFKKMRCVIPCFLSYFSIVFVVKYCCLYMSLLLFKVS